MTTNRSEQEYREPDELMIPSKDGFIVIPTQSIRAPEETEPASAEGMSRWRTYQFFNIIQFGLMLAGMLGLLAYVGYAVAGIVGLVTISIVGAIGFFMVSNNSVNRVLRSRYIRPIGFSEGFTLYAMVEELAAKAGLEKVPRLFLDRRPLMNAYTVEDKERSAIILSEALLGTLSKRELKGVLAHEMAHLKNSDIGIMVFSEQIRRLTGYMAIAGQIMVLFYLPLMLFNQVAVPWSLLLVLLAAPAVSTLFHIALSRNREFKADMDAVTLSGDARGLASALGKINIQSRFWQKLVAPYFREVPELLRTHPNTESRIERLRAVQQERDVHFAWNL